VFSMQRLVLLAAIVLGTCFPSVALATEMPPPPRFSNAAGLKWTPVQPGARQQILTRPRRSDLTDARSDHTDASGLNAAGEFINEVKAEGPTAGPVGLIIPFFTPACAPKTGTQGVLVIYVDHEEVGFYTGAGLRYPVQDTFWTMQTPYRELGSHQLSFGCYDSGAGEDEQVILFIESWDSPGLWKDEGVHFENTGPPLPTPLSAQHAGPGYVLETPAGAPAGLSPCPTVDATPWRTVRIGFYSWRKEQWLLPEDRYLLSNPAVSGLTALPFQIPASAAEGEQLAIAVECNRPPSAGPFEAGFTFLNAGVLLDVPAGGPLRLGELAGGGHNPSERCMACFLSRVISFVWPVDASTGNFWHSFTDFDIPGRGPALNLTRTYNSSEAGKDGPFGHGWSFPYGMSLSFPDSSHVVVNQENGAQVTFTEQEDETYTAPPRVDATLARKQGGGWAFVRLQRETLDFDAAGRLTQEADLAGNVTALEYDGAGHLESVTAPSGRSLAFAYDGDHIAHVADPLGREFSYAYDGAGDLTDVTDARGGNTHFTYDADHRLLTMRSPNQEPGAQGSTGATISNTYDSEGRVISQTDQLGHTTTFAYSGEPLGEGGTTTITDPRGDVTVQEYRFGELLTETKGHETLEEAAWSFDYDPGTLGVTRITDPNGESTMNTFDSEGNLLETTDPLGHTTTYTHDALGDVTSETDPRGTTTSYTYDGVGGLIEKATPLLGTGQTARTRYGYEAAPGEVTSITDPNGHTTSFDYDSAGDRTGVTDANGDKTTSAFNLDGERIATTSPAGNAPGGDPTAHTITYSHDAAGELTGETDPLGHTTTYAYDGDGNRTTVTDASGRQTDFHYDAAGEPTKVGRPDGSTLETHWDAAGNMSAQVDAAGQVTSYAYDPLDRVTSVTDPKGRVTKYVYDGAGNETEMIDAEGRVTYYGYDGDDELTSIYYSDGSTPRVEQEFDEDGNRIRRSDGTGISSFAYDLLNRLTSSTDGSGATLAYEYDLAGDLTKLTYPNGQSVTRAYDPAGRLATVTDWLGHSTHFDYDADSNLVGQSYPNGVSTELAYDNADRLGSIADAVGGDPLASFDYTRDASGQLTSEAVDNGSSATNLYARNLLSQLSAAGEAPYDYNAADDPTTFGVETSQEFDTANELITATGPDEAPEIPVEPEVPGENPVPPGGGGGGGGEGGGPTPSPGFGGGGRAPFAEFEPNFHFAEAQTSPPHAEETATTRADGRGRVLRVHRMDVSQPRGLLLAFVSASGSHQGVNQVKGGGLRWTRLRRERDDDGVVEIWRAETEHGFDGSPKIYLARRSRLATATVAAFGGSAYLAASGADHGGGTAPTTSLRAPAGSALWAVGHGSGQRRPAAAGAAGKVVSGFFDGRVRSAGWVQSAMAHSGATGLSSTVPARSWALAAVAILSAAADDAHASEAASHRPAGALAMRDGVARTANGPGGSAGTASGAPIASSGQSAIATREFSYDGRGDRIGERVSARTLRTLSYDQAGRLIGLNGVISYSYDGDGLRVSKTVEGSTTHFVWGGGERLPELLQDGTRYYVYGLAGEPIEEIEGPSVTYLHKDQQGSVRLLTDSAGEVAGRYDYGPWGLVSDHSGAATSSLQFDGQYADPETGYQYLRSRYYDPLTGQFLTVDPALASTRSRYGFAANDPLDYADPTGLGPCLLGHNPNGSCRGGSEAIATTKGVHVVTGAVATGAAICAAVAGASVVGNFGVSEACGVAAGVSGGLSLASGEVLYATGHESTGGLIVDTAGVVPFDRFVGRPGNLAGAGIGAYGTASSIVEWNEGGGAGLRQGAYGQAWCQGSLSVQGASRNSTNYLQPAWGGLQ
jgi:RHS repeat-associated protein